MAAEAEPAAAQANKRYRPAPAKTFQCKGYGDCRMVFSRSEHLARHIRKHTGERPFACHCSKQFSRLDNLRQHAQTVHADKQDQNERMMRDLTSLHASMAAANKIGGAVRGGRRTNTGSSASTTSTTQASNPQPGSSPHGTNGELHGQNGSIDGDAERTASPMDMVKQEDLPSISYDTSELYHPAHWPSHPPTHHNDLDGSPKFFAQPPLTFSSGGSRPSTSERLPPLSTIIPNSQQQQQQQQQLYGSSPPAMIPAHLRPRPSTATRPGSSSETATSFYPNPNLPAAALLSSSNNNKSLYSSHPPLHYARGYGSFSEDPTPAGESSPFYFAPPAEKSTSTSTSSSNGNAPSNNGSNTSPPPPPGINSRKRSFAAPDGPLHSYDELAAYNNPHHPGNHPSGGGGGGGLDYDYGSESRPQSRRLTVMELCNDGTSELSAAIPQPIPRSTSNSLNGAGGGGGGYAVPQVPPPRPHSTFSVSSATSQHSHHSHASVSPPMAHLQSSYAAHHGYHHSQQHSQQQQQSQSQHHQQQSQQQQQYNLSLHHGHAHQQQHPNAYHHPHHHAHHSPLPTPTATPTSASSLPLPPNSAASFYSASPRNAGPGPMAHQQAQAFQALQAQHHQHQHQQQQQQYGYGNVGVGVGVNVNVGMVGVGVGVGVGGYEYGSGYGA